MRIILLFFAACLYVSPAYAYIEIKQKDETQVTAGDQHSSMYRLNDKSADALKKLKQADEYVTRVHAAGKAVNANDLETLLLSDKEDKERQQLKQMMLDAEMKMRSPRMLIVQPDHDVYVHLYATRSGQIKDAQTARALWRELKGGGK